jgi:hypothetical protein
MMMLMTQTPMDVSSDNSCHNAKQAWSTADKESGPKCSASSDHTTSAHGFKRRLLLLIFPPFTASLSGFTIRKPRHNKQHHVIIGEALQCK